MALHHGNVRYSEPALDCNRSWCWCRGIVRIVVVRAGSDVACLCFVGSMHQTHVHRLVVWPNNTLDQLCHLAWRRWWLRCIRRPMSSRRVLHDAFAQQAHDCSGLCQRVHCTVEYCDRSLLDMHHYWKEAATWP
jgi:hypothetical protein